MGIWRSRLTRFGSSEGLVNIEHDAPVVDFADLLKRLLEIVGESALLVSPGEKVLYAAPELFRMGIIKDGRIKVEALSALIRRARKTSEGVEDTLDLRGTPGMSLKPELLVKAICMNELGPGTVLVFIADEGESQLVDQVRKDFVANISHELKTPIGALSILSEAILGATDDPKAVKRFAERMQIESKRLGDLVQDIIDLSRLQSHGPLTNAIEFEIASSILEAVDQCRLAALDRDISVEFGDFPRINIYGNREQITTAVSNLINNAIAYSPVKTKIGVGVDESEGYVEVSVTDQGIGISEPDRDRIFERFYRVDPARSRATGGTGLGLSIVKHIVSNHGGEVRLWSQEGLGSTFTIRLPISIKS